MLKNFTVLYTLIAFCGIALSPFSANAISPSAEEELSVRFMKEVHERFEIVNDPVVVRYVESMGNRIVRVLPPQPFRYRFFVINEPSYNAFAGPGGVIFIHSGLIEAMDNEHELAGILGHEITHVYARHISDRIKRSKQIGIVTLAGLVSAIALGATGAGTVASAAVLGSLAAGKSMELAYTREDETQADQLGLEFLVKAGFNPQGLLTMMEKIRQQQWFGTDQVPTYLRTHPAADDRVAYLSSWIESKKGDTSLVPIDTLKVDFQKMRNRIKAIYGDVQSAEDYFQQALDQAPENAMAWYGAALVAERKEAYEDALEGLKKVVSRHAFDTDILTDLGRVYFKAGQYQKAKQLLNSALTQKPNMLEGRYYLGRTDLELGDTDAALASFEVVADKKPNYRQNAYFLAQIYGQKGRKGEAYYQLGSWYDHKKDAEAAIAQYKKALQLVQASEKKKAIAERIKELQHKLANKQRQ